MESALAGEGRPWAFAEEEMLVLQHMVRHGARATVPSRPKATWTARKTARLSGSLESDQRLHTDTLTAATLTAWHRRRRSLRGEAMLLQRLVVGIVWRK